MRFLWHFILYRKGNEENLSLRCHEYDLWRQALRWGVLPRYLIHVILLPFYLAKEVKRYPLEAPAYGTQEEIIHRLAAGQGIDQHLTELVLA